MEIDGAAQLRRGIIGPCILALLSDRSRYGLELVRDLDAAGQLVSSQGTIYPLLGRLQGAGLITSRWETGDVDRPRRYYDLTDAGRVELTSFAREWAAFSASVDALIGSAVNGSAG